MAVSSGDCWRVEARVASSKFLDGRDAGCPPARVSNTRHARGGQIRPKLRTVEKREATMASFDRARLQISPFPPPATIIINDITTLENPAKLSLRRRNGGKMLARHSRRWWHWRGCAFVDGCFPGTWEGNRGCSEARRAIRTSARSPPTPSMQAFPGMDGPSPGLLVSCPRVCLVDAIPPIERNCVTATRGSFGM